MKKSRFVVVYSGVFSGRADVIARDKEEARVQFKKSHPCSTIVSVLSIDASIARFGA